MNAVINPPQTRRYCPIITTRVLPAWQQYLDVCQDEGVTALSDPDLRGVLYRVWSYSDFVMRACIREPLLLQQLIEGGDLLRSYPVGTHLDLLREQLFPKMSAEDLARILRQFRQREMLRIAWRDLAGWANVHETMRDTTAVADATIQVAASMHDAWLKQEYGRPCNRYGKQQKLLVLAMGKMGAGELNFSSDIDLIFTFPESGKTRGKPDSIENEEYFERLSRALIQALDNNTADGFVFRVDMRLRPFGESGPLVLNFDAMENYYQAHGRDWERYALIKARVVTGPQFMADQLQAIMSPFIYRRYLDFSAIESLRDMKNMISRQVARKGMKNNVKLGAGGIREVEFLGQVYQLIRGGREPSLRQREILNILDTLLELSLLPEYIISRLKEAYCFLRDVENRLQMYRDGQTHQLPDTSERRLMLAMSMGYQGWKSFYARLTKYMQFVHEQFESSIMASVEDESDPATQFVSQFWDANLSETNALAMLKGLGYDEPERVMETLNAFRGSYVCRVMGDESRQRLLRLLPILLSAVSVKNKPEITFHRVLHIVEKVVQRSVYLMFLIEYPIALTHLVDLCSRSEWIANTIAEHPMLLDELLDLRQLQEVMSKPALAADISRQLNDVHEDNVERMLDVLRECKLVHDLRVAIADLGVDYPIMKVSDRLVDFAEVMLNQVLEMSMREMVKRYGRPAQRKGTGKQVRYAIVAYGKLGGRELGYGSDLDIIFLHDAEEDGVTDGRQSIHNQVFFTRLSQRIVTLLTTQTTSGVLYEVDIRLRPNGASGMLVNSLAAFEDYQRQSAWTWEHQALVRARVVAGHPDVASGFQHIRENILSIQRDKDTLRQDVSAMRQRMRTELCKQQSGKFDLKQAAGGIADIEFMVQYSVLRWACAHSKLLQFTDNYCLLEALAELGLWTTRDVAGITKAYMAYRTAAHHLSLQGQKPMADASCFNDERNHVKKMWQRLFAETIE